jgi:hypothetical protein
MSSELGPASRTGGNDTSFTYEKTVIVPGDNVSDGTHRRRGPVSRDE